MFLKKILKPVAIFLCVVGLIVAARYLYLEEQGNFHPITAGEAYRSAQLNQDLLEEYLTMFNIRSIINLRGESDETWYRDELKISKKMHVRHYDLKLDATEPPANATISKLLKLFASAPRPVLIHCQAGADRSGLASALWKIVIDKKSKSIASQQLSIRFGHVPFGPTLAMDRFFAKWQPAVKMGNP